MLETISSTEMILACLRPWLMDLETQYIPWFLSGVEGIGVNHSMYARCVGGCAACEDCVDGNISEITAAGIWKTIRTCAILYFFFFFFFFFFFCIEFNVICATEALLDRCYVSYKCSIILYVGWPEQGRVLHTVAQRSPGGSADSYHYGNCMKEELSSIKSFTCSHPKVLSEGGGGSGQLPELHHQARGWPQPHSCHGH